MIGIKHQTLLNWLEGSWRLSGPPVCIIEGFSGVGKTEIALELERQAADEVVVVDAPEDGNFQSLFLALAEKLANKEYFELSEAVEAGQALERVFESILRLPIVMVIDEFQRMLTAEHLLPTKQMRNLLERISRNVKLPGRLLLLTHRGMDKTQRWSERIEFRSLPGLSPDEGAELLTTLLQNRGREEDVAPEQRPEISKWLGGNPRAIGVLVGCLEQEPLHSLTGVIPEAWEARDQEPSEWLLTRLERVLLQRVVAGMKPGLSATMQHLSVYRIPFNRDALERQLPSGISLNDAVRDFTSRFLLKQRAGWYEMNPLARELSLHKLKEDDSASHAVHRNAAQHYSRHFIGKQIVNAGRLGSTFIEARYHLVQSGEEAQLKAIVQRFGAYLRSTYTQSSKPPEDPIQRDEQIGVLAAFLAEGGPKAMEYYLARLFVARNRAGDNHRALEHIRKATGKEAPASTWVLRLRLEAQEAGLDEMLRVARQGFRYVTPERSLATLYQEAGELLAIAGRTNEALELLREAISRIEPPQGLHALYRTAGAIHFSAGRANAAVETLREGISVIPVGKFNRHWLIEAALYISASIYAIELIQQIVTQAKADGDTPQAALGEEILLEVRNEWINAADYVSRVKGQLPAYYPLQLRGAFASLCASEPERAYKVLADRGVRLQERDGSSWLQAMIAVYLDDKSLAGTALSAYLGRALSLEEEPTISWLLELWKQSVGEVMGLTPAYLFPNLPPTITGGCGWLHRMSNLADSIGGKDIAPPIGVAPAISAGVSNPPAMGAAIPNTADIQSARASIQSRSILVVATEWEPQHGGLSSFNRDLCRTLATRKHRLVCAVPTASSAEQADAKVIGVHLVQPEPISGLEDAGVNSLLMGIKLPTGFRPQIIIGHDRKTGPHAVALARKFTDVRRVHFIHTRPEDIEWYKDKLGDDDAALKAEERRELQRKLAEGAQIVAAVGPDLKTAAGALLYTTLPRPAIVRVDPGILVVERPAELPPEAQCLVLGRAEDFELKGLDIAAVALGRVARRGIAQPSPRLIVRGAPEGTGAELWRRLAELAGGSLPIEVREYTPNVSRLRDDILNASLMLMPSRSEGFGLVGLEAIAAMTPILISKRSGLSTLLEERLGRRAERFLVEVLHDFDATVTEWERRIETTLINREAAFSHAEELRRTLAQTMTWDNTAVTLEAAWDQLFRVQI